MEIRVERVVAAVPDRVMRTLTDPAALANWACDEAQMTDSFLLKGRSVPLGQMGGPILERTNERLTFQWPMGGGPSPTDQPTDQPTCSIVQIGLEGVPQKGNPPADFTRVVIQHTQIPAGALGARWEKESWEAIWSLWLRHLAGWLERADARGHFDYSAPCGRTVEQSILVDAPTARVWRALTDPAVRERWLSVPLGQELQREEGRLLVCEFPLDNPPTTLTWRLEAVSDGQTRVTIREEGLTWAGLDNHIGWQEFLVALHEEVAPLLVRQSMLIKGAPARVWRYVATQEGLRRWFAENIRIEPHVGGAIAFEEHGGAVRGKVVALEPERRLAFTWTEEGAPGWSQDPAPLLLTIDLVPVPEQGGTRVTITHGGFESLPEAIRLREFGSYQRGWAYGTTLPTLQQIIEEDLSHAERV